MLDMGIVMEGYVERQGVRLYPYMKLSYSRRRNLDVGPAIAKFVAGIDEDTIEGEKRKQHHMGVSLGLKLKTNDRWGWSVRYNGDYTKFSTSHGASLRLKWKF